MVDGVGGRELLESSIPVVHVVHNRMVEVVRLGLGQDVLVVAVVRIGLVQAGRVVVAAAAAAATLVSTSAVVVVGHRITRSAAANHGHQMAAAAVAVRSSRTAAGLLAALLLELHLLDEIDGLLDRQLAVAVLVVLAEEARRRQYLDNRAPAMEEHAHELEHQDEREEDEEHEAEYLHLLLGPVVQSADGYLELGKGDRHVLELKLGHNPQRVEHEEGKARVVAQLLEVARDPLLLDLVLAERMQVLVDEALPEGHLLGVQVVDVVLAEELHVDPVGVVQVVARYFVHLRRRVVVGGRGALGAREGGRLDVRAAAARDGDRRGRAVLAGERDVAVVVVRRGLRLVGDGVARERHVVRRRRLRLGVVERVELGDELVEQTLLPVHRRLDQTVEEVGRVLDHALVGLRAHYVGHEAVALGSGRRCGSRGRCSCCCCLLVLAATTAFLLLVGRTRRPLGDDLARSPRDHVQVAYRVDDEQDVAAGQRDQVEQTVGEIEELLRMQTAGDDEQEGEEDEEERRGADLLRVGELSDGRHQHHGHDHRVDRGHESAHHHLRLGARLQTHDQIEESRRDRKRVRLGQREAGEDGAERAGHREQNGARAENGRGEQEALFGGIHNYDTY